MDVLLINPSPLSLTGLNSSTIYPPLGLLYLANTAKRLNRDVTIIDINALKMSSEKFISNSKDLLQSDFIGISANVLTSESAIMLGKKIKNCGYKGQLIAGGPMPTVMPEYFLDTFDIVVRNEGERTFEEILMGVPLKEIKGITYKKNGTIFHNEDRKLIENLDALLYPDYSMLNPCLRKYHSRSRGFPVAPIITSRGCPYHCVFCNKNIFGHKFRARSPQNVVDEIEYLMNVYGVRQIDILDDNFTLDLKRAEEILDCIIERELRVFINLQNGICESRINEKLIKKMKRAGVYKIGIGIESGNKKILELNKKDVDLERVKKIIGLLRNEGIIVYGFFMLGMLGDTMETMLDTINFAIEANPHIADFSIAIPFPGTELYKFVEKNGRFLVNPRGGYKYGFFSGKAYYETEKTRPEDVERAFSIAYRKFYMRPSKIIDILRTIKSLREFAWTVSSAYEIFNRQ